MLASNTLKLFLEKIVEKMVKLIIRRKIVPPYHIVTGETTCPISIFINPTGLSAQGKGTLNSFPVPTGPLSVPPCPKVGLLCPLFISLVGPTILKLGTRFRRIKVINLNKLKLEELKALFVACHIHNIS